MTENEPIFIKIKNIIKNIFKRKRKPRFKTRKEKIIYEIKSWAYVLIAVYFIRSGIVCAYQIPTGSMKNTIKIGDFILGNQIAYGIRTPDWFGIPFTRKGFFIPHLTIPTFNKPNSGDIVIFEYPIDPWTNYVKRCVAGPGDYLEIIDKKVYVNGERFEDPKKSVIDYENILSKDYSEPNIFPHGNGNKDQYHKIYIPKEGDTLDVNETNIQIIAYVAYMDGNKIEYGMGAFYLDGEQIEKYIVEQDYYFMMGDNRDNSADSRYWGFVPQKYILGTPLVRYLSWDKTVSWSKFYNKIRWKQIFRPMR